MVIVSVIVLMPPAWIALGENDLLIVGLDTTNKLAVFDTGPAGNTDVLTPLVALGLVPDEVLVTVNVIVQPTAEILMPLKFNAVWPFVKLPPVMAPQVPATVCAPATLILLKVSVNAPAVCAMPVGLVSVKVMVDVPPL